MFFTMIVKKNYHKLWQRLTRKESTVPALELSMALKYNTENDNATDQHNEHNKFSYYSTSATSFSSSHLLCLHLIFTTSTLLVSAKH